jgi:hypothetical protein
VSLKGSDDGPNKIACSIAFPVEGNSGMDHGDLVDPTAPPDQPGKVASLSRRSSPHADLRFPPAAADVGV